MTVALEDLPLVGCPGTLRLRPYARDEIREGGRYAYRFAGTGTPVQRIEPTELFRRRPDDPDAGDFVPRNCVGTVVVQCTLADGSIGRASITVLPAKLSYETEYRQMLMQIADYAAEAILQGYAPASRQVAAQPAGDAAIAYRALAFIASRLRDETFRAALLQIRHRPHEGWNDVQERRPLGRGARASRDLAPAMQRPGGRALAAGDATTLPFESLPASLDAHRSDSTYDTPANRFVRHVMARWQAIAVDVLTAVRSSADLGAGPLGRAEDEARWVADVCEEMLSEVPLRDAGSLHTFPAADQTLLRRAGYREVLRAFALTETSMALDVDLPHEVFSASHRNVAALYEYWCFLVLVRAVSSIAGGPSPLPLFEPSPGGMRLVLRQGKASRLFWQLDVEGRAIEADLWYNRTFATRSEVSADASWSQRLRPDASLRLRPMNGRPLDTADPSLDVWIHFDAKYRVDGLGIDDPAADTTDRQGARTVTRDDVLKMHAYRDAIRRSAGAYVLHPGDGPSDIRREFHELLPGVGAFPLRPGPDGEATGTQALTQFLRDVCHNVANQASARERTQYWSALHNDRPGLAVSPVGFLERPPADTLVLIGYARRSQLSWIWRTNQYNLRLGGRAGAVTAEDEMLGAHLVVVWTGRPGHRSVGGVFRRSGPWHVATADELAAEDYPSTDPSARYLVAPLQPLPPSTASLVRPDALTAHSSSTYHPSTTTWDQLSQ